MEVTPPLDLPAPRSRPWLVRGMVGIDRPAVSPDVALVAVCFQLFLAAAVAVLAQRLQFPEIEQLVIAMMGRDVVRQAAGVTTFLARHMAHRGNSVSCSLARRCQRLVL